MRVARPGSSLTPHFSLLYFKLLRGSVDLLLLFLGLFINGLLHVAGTLLGLLKIVPGRGDACGAGRSRLGLWCWRPP